MPPGHMIQQIVDENGTLRHIILSATNCTSGVTCGVNSVTTCSNSLPCKTAPHNHSPCSTGTSSAVAPSSNTTTITNHHHNHNGSSGNNNGSAAPASSVGAKSSNKSVDYSTNTSSNASMTRSGCHATFANHSTITAPQSQPFLVNQLFAGQPPPARSSSSASPLSSMSAASASVSAVPNVSLSSSMSTSIGSTNGLHSQSAASNSMAVAAAAAAAAAVSGSTPHPLLPYPYCCCCCYECSPMPTIVRNAGDSGITPVHGNAQSHILNKSANSLSGSAPCNGTAGACTAPTQPTKQEYTLPAYACNGHSITPPNSHSISHRSTFNSLGQPLIAFSSNASYANHAQQPHHPQHHQQPLNSNIRRRCPTLTPSSGVIHNSNLNQPSNNHHNNAQSFLPSPPGASSTCLPMPHSTASPSTVSSKASATAAGTANFIGAKSTNSTTSGNKGEPMDVNRARANLALALAQNLPYHVGMSTPNSHHVHLHHQNNSQHSHSSSNHQIPAISNSASTNAALLANESSISHLTPWYGSGHRSSAANHHSSNASGSWRKIRPDPLTNELNSCRPTFRSNSYTNSPFTSGGATISTSSSMLNSNRSLPFKSHDRYGYGGLLPMSGHNSLSVNRNQHVHDSLLPNGSIIGKNGLIAPMHVRNTIIDEVGGDGSCSPTSEHYEFGSNDSELNSGGSASPVHSLASPKRSSVCDHLPPGSNRLTNSIKPSRAARSVNSSPCKKAAPPSTLTGTSSSSASSTSSVSASSSPSSTCSSSIGTYRKLLVRKQSGDTLLDLMIVDDDCDSTNTTKGLTNTNRKVKHHTNSSSLLNRSPDAPNHVVRTDGAMLHKNALQRSCDAIKSDLDFSSKLIAPSQRDSSQLTVKSLNVVANRTISNRSPECKAQSRCDPDRTRHESCPAKSILPDTDASDEIDEVSGDNTLSVDVVLNDKIVKHSDRTESNDDADANPTHVVCNSISRETIEMQSDTTAIKSSHDQSNEIDVKRSDRSECDTQVPGEIDKSSEPSPVFNHSPASILHSSSCATVASISPTPIRLKQNELPQVLAFRLIYTSLTSSGVKLKWSHNLSQIEQNDLTVTSYQVEMWQSRSDPTSLTINAVKPHSRLVYNGPVKHCRVLQLVPEQEYAFRVRAVAGSTFDANKPNRTEAQLWLSNTLTITTPKGVGTVVNGFVPSPSSGTSLPHTFNGLRKRNGRPHSAAQSSQSIANGSTHGSPLVACANTESLVDLSSATVSGAFLALHCKWIAFCSHFTRDQSCAFGLLLLFCGIACTFAYMAQHLIDV